MRKLPVALLSAIALAACSHGSSSSTSQSTTTQASPVASASAAAAMPMASASAAASAPVASPAAGGTIPSYPGATNVMTASANGETTSESSTKDPFDTVNAWYQSRLPAGSQAEKLTIGNVQEVIYKVGDSTVSIASSNGQTVITIANKP
jgi:hypothetical protein